MNRLLVGAVAIAALAVAEAPAAEAGLALEAQVIEVIAKPEDDTAAAVFVFHNRSGRAVSVRSVESACSCLTVSLDKAVYQPGEKGTGRAEVRLQNLVGRHERVAVAHTDNPAQPEWVLPVVVEVPVLVRLEPKSVHWQVGDPIEPKTVRVRMTGTEPVRVLSVSSTQTGVECTFKEVAPGKEYEISIRPQASDRAVMGAVQIQTDSRHPKHQRQLAFFSVHQRPAGGRAEQR